MIIINNNLILTSPGYFSKNCWDPVNNHDAEAVESSCSLKEALPEEPPSLSKIHMISLSSPIAITYTLCAGDADRAGDEC